VDTKEAVRRCEFWTTTVSETRALGSTSDPEVAEHFGALNSKDEFQWERWSNPERRGWAIYVPRWTGSKDDRTENAAYTMIVEEIERRASS
jgi:hypothetical protein